MAAPNRRDSRVDTRAQPVALIVLSTDDVASVPGADQYRALCLLALGRIEETERLVESLIRRNPSFRMSVTDVTPRMIALFEQTRQRSLPGILEDRYREAKATYEQGRYSDATTQFNASLSGNGLCASCPPVIGFDYSF